LAGLAVPLDAIWKILLAFIVVMPIAGYSVQYLVTPIVNRLVEKLWDRFGLDEPSDDQA
jgi:hypothetical protein